MKLHQLLVQSKNEILHRDVSCACVLSEECSGHVLKVSKVAHDQPVKAQFLQMEIVSLPLKVFLHLARQTKQ